MHSSDEKKCNPALIQQFHPQTGEVRLAKATEADASVFNRGVLRAFLHVPSYKHGVRSMEAIVAMSLRRDPDRFERSALPSEAQLNLHVNGSRFLGLVQQVDLSGALLEQLAEAVHEAFRERRSKEKAEELGPYAQLREEEKGQNRSFAWDIERKLDKVGYLIRPRRSDQPLFELTPEAIDRLAEMEHDRWMFGKFQAGWWWAKKTDKDKFLHEDLLPWQELSEEDRRSWYGANAERLGPGVLPEKEKEKDREMVQDIPTMLAKIGYAPVKVDKPVRKDWELNRK